MHYCILMLGTATGMIMCRQRDAVLYRLISIAVHYCKRLCEGFGYVLAIKRNL